MKLAIVHDWLDGYTFKERILENILEIFPDSPIYTLIYNPEKMPTSFKDYTIHTTFFQTDNALRKKYRKNIHMMPHAFEQLDLREYDIIISITESCAKGVLTRPDAKHICYCMDTIPEAWHNFQIELSKRKGFDQRNFITNMHNLRIWDKCCVDRIDSFIASSANVQEQISKYYRRMSYIIEPPVQVYQYVLPPTRDTYYVCYSSSPMIDDIIALFTTMGLNLLVIVDDIIPKSLLDAPLENIVAIHNPTFEALSEYLLNARAFIHTTAESFSNAPIQALSCGAPVIAYAGSGVAETIRNNSVGILYDKQDINSLKSAISTMELHGIPVRSDAVKQAGMAYNEGRFRYQFKEFFEKELRLSAVKINK